MVPRLMFCLLLDFCLIEQITNQNVGSRTQTILKLINNSGYTNEFSAIIQKSYILRKMLEGTSDTAVMYTVFVPTRWAFGNLTIEKRERILNMEGVAAENFIKFYCVINRFEINQNTVPGLVEKRSEAADSNRLFIQQKVRWFSQGGNTGMTQFYVNGAQITEPNKYAMNGLVHYIDRVLDVSSNKKAYGYLADASDPGIRDMISSFSLMIVQSEYYEKSPYQEIITDLRDKEGLTFFIPSNEAIKIIPKDKQLELKQDYNKYLEMLRSHIIPDHIAFTSYLEQNQPFPTYQRRTIYLRKNVLDEVYVSSNGVVAKITHGNITVGNGVVHIVDRMLGYVYYSAWEQITKDIRLRLFADILRRARSDTQEILQQHGGVTIFVPVNTSFSYITGLMGVDLDTDEAQLNMVVSLHILELGERVELSQVPGGFSARMVKRSTFNNKEIMIYNAGNDTWVQGGHVKARVIRQDVGVKNGIVHYIDSVLGIPSADIPTMVYYEHWLMRSYDSLCMTGLVNYLRDPYFDPNKFPSRPNNPWNIYNARSACAYNHASQNAKSLVTPNARGVCGETGHRCDFTLFIPNGTSITNFQLTAQGRKIMENLLKFRYVLMRHIVRKKIYIEDLRDGYSDFTTENGDRISIYKQVGRYAELNFKGRRANILHWDIGATNGVIHIIDPLLFTSDDLIGAAGAVRVSWLIVTVSILLMLNSINLNIISPTFAFI